MKQPGSIIALVIFAFIPLVGVSQVSTATTRQASTSREHPKGFVDYVLGKVNPEGKDYGVMAAAIRDQMVKDTIDDLYFWSNAFALLMLGCASGALYLSLRSARKKETITVALITQLYNGRVSDHLEIDLRTAQYNELVEKHNAEIERHLAATSRAQSADQDTSTRIKRTAEKLEKQNSGTVGSGDNSRSSTVQVADKQSTLLMEHRLEAMQNTEQNLRERLNQTTVELERERQKNARLKGM